MSASASSSLRTLSPASDHQRSSPARPAPHSVAWANAAATVSFLAPLGGELAGLLRSRVCFAFYEAISCQNGPRARTCSITLCN